MPFALRHALREIRNHPRFSAFFAFNLALGLAGFVALDAFESSVAAELASRSRTFLGADLEVLSSRPLTSDEVRALDEAAGPRARKSVAVELFSMAAGPERARLVEIRAVDAAFPLYGEIVLRGEGALTAAHREAFDALSGSWVDPALFAPLAVEIGDTLRVGTSRFRIQHAVERDGARSSSSFSMAPRVYLPLRALSETGLIQRGSRVRYRTLYRFDDRPDLSAVSAALASAVDDESIQIRSHVAATRQLARGFGAVNDYLGLVSLIALFLAGLGTAHLFREFLARRVRDLAILLSLGATRTGAQTIFLVQLWLLSLAAAGLATGLAAVLLPMFAREAAGFVPDSLIPTVGLRSIVLAGIVAMGSSTVACLPMLMRIRALEPAALFAEHASPRLERGRDLLLLLPALLLFWGVAVWRVGDLFAGSLFAAVFGAALTLFAAIGAGALRLLPRVRAGGALGLRLALRHLSRAHASSVGGFVSLALCAFLLSLAPQLQSTLSDDLDPPDGGRLPSLFLFDIQPEQLPDLTDHVASQSAELQRTSPMVRALLHAIDGRPIAEHAETAGEARRLRTRRYNLTYRPDVTLSEKRVAGRAFGAAPHDPDTPAEISLESDFADRLGVGLGSLLTFDVQGVPVSGRVVELRAVRWNSFQPNFFVAFQPGVLEDAPQIYLASISKLGDEARAAVQASIVDRFPNVSVIDVTETVRRMLRWGERLQWALQSTASAALVVGMVLIYAIARDQARARRGETNLLKVLGADFGTIRLAVDVEFALLGLLAAGVGAGVSIGASYVFSTALLETAFGVDPTPLLAAVVGTPLLCVVTARLATRVILRERPLALLQAAEA